MVWVFSFNSRAGFCAGYQLSVAYSQVVVASSPSFILCFSSLHSRLRCFPPASLCIRSCVAIRKHLGIPKDGCGTACLGSSQMRVGSSQARQNAAWPCLLNFASLSPCAASLLNFLKWLSLPQFLSVHCMSRSSLPACFLPCSSVPLAAHLSAFQSLLLPCCPLSFCCALLLCT